MSSGDNEGYAHPRPEIVAASALSGYRLNNILFNIIYIMRIYMRHLPGTGHSGKLPPNRALHAHHKDSGNDPYQTVFIAFIIATVRDSFRRGHCTNPRRTPRRVSVVRPHRLHGQLELETFCKQNWKIARFRWKLVVRYSKTRKLVVPQQPEQETFCEELTF